LNEQRSKTICIGSNDNYIFVDFIVIAMVLQTPIVIIWPVNWSPIIAMLFSNCRVTHLRVQ
jgi:hypothetical protein